MQVIDPGHEYTLDSLDGEQVNRLIFVKREGEKFPGNVGSHPGTNMQEVLRALINRATYLNGQIPCFETEEVLRHLRAALLWLEARAAQRHGRVSTATMKQMETGEGKCRTCGHCGCVGDCHEVKVPAVPEKGETLFGTMREAQFAADEAYRHDGRVRRVEPRGVSWVVVLTEGESNE